MSQQATCSDNSGREFYDVERWAGRRRVTELTDNNAKFIGGPGVAEPPNLPGKEFLESTLPYELVITTPTDTLSGPQHAMPFVSRFRLRLLKHKMSSALLF